jgi:hypothetical protein
MAALFQLLFLGLPLFLLLAPRKIYGWVLGVFVLAVGWLSWELGRPMSMDNDWGPWGQMIVMGAMLLWLAAYGLRALIDLIVSRKFRLDPIDYRPFRAGLAIVLTGWSGWQFASPIARWVGGWTLLIIGAAVSLFLLTFAWRSVRGRWVLIPVGATIIVGMVNILSWPPAVARAAEARAVGQPYCIMIGDGDGDYRPARTVLDLSPLLMRATESPHLRNQHALLIFRGGGGLHFSYRRERFEQGYEGDEYVDHPLCTPRPFFAAQLPLW